MFAGLRRVRQLEWPNQSTSRPDQKPHLLRYSAVPCSIFNIRYAQRISNFSFDFKQKDLYIRDRRIAAAAHLLKSRAVAVQLLKVEDN